MRLALSLLLLCAACSRGPSAADVAEIARLEAVRDTVRREIAAAELEPRFPPGSLIEIMRGARRDALNRTDAMLRLRVEALRAGVAFEWREPATRANPARADSLARDVAALRDSARAADQEAVDLPAGSMFANLAQVRAATHRTSATLLDAARLDAMYGLGSMLAGASIR